MTGTEYKSMNNFVLNQGSSYGGGWGACQMRKDLNGYTSSEDEQDGNKTDFNGLGKKLSNWNFIKQVRKQYIKTHWDGGSVTTCEDYLWLLSYSEMVTWGVKDGYFGYAPAKEGELYQYYKGMNVPYGERIVGLNKKSSESGSEYWWLLRSPNWEYQGHVGRVDFYNGASSISLTFADAEGGVAPGFCI